MADGRWRDCVNSALSFRINIKARGSSTTTPTPTPPSGHTSHQSGMFGSFRSFHSFYRCSPCTRNRKSEIGKSGIRNQELGSRNQEAGTVIGSSIHAHEKDKVRPYGLDRPCILHFRQPGYDVLTLDKLTDTRVKPGGTFP